MLEIEVGQKLWFVPRQRYLGEPKFVTVEKCGRKWLTLDNGYRADVATLNVDGGRGYYSPAACYYSREEWEAEKALKEAWVGFRGAVDRSLTMPSGTTLERIEQARKMLAL